VVLAGVGVDAAGRGPVRVHAALGLGIAGAALLLRLPVVADLLERVLQRRQGGAVRALAVAVLLGRAVQGLGVRVLGLLRRTLDGAGQVLSRRHTPELPPRRRAQSSESRSRTSSSACSWVSSEETSATLPSWYRSMTRGATYEARATGGEL